MRTKLTTENPTGNEFRLYAARLVAASFEAENFGNIGAVAQSSSTAVTAWCTRPDGSSFGMEVSGEDFVSSRLTVLAEDGRVMNPPPEDGEDELSGWESYYTSPAYAAQQARDRADAIAYAALPREVPDGVDEATPCYACGGARLL